MKKRYPVLPELLRESNFQLPQFFMTRLGSNLYNIFADLSCIKIQSGQMTLMVSKSDSQELSNNCD